jgi:hypothetical protein
MEINTSIEPEPKRQKGLLPVDTASSVGTVAIDSTASAALLVPNTIESVLSTDVTANWWDSGDARRLFAPCSILYGTNCDVKEIVMERIEILESVNCAASNWKNVVDTRMGGPFQSHYSESNVFSLRYRSMYLALALKQFVLNVTGDLRSQWTWKRLHFAIEAMNDVGVEFYSNFSTLSRWHRKFARHRYYFYKVPEAKTVCPGYFVDNPDAMEAFKNHGEANMKDLWVEMMLEYVHNELVPKLMVKRDGCLLNDDVDHGDAVVGVVETVTPTTKEAFL